MGSYSPNFKCNVLIMIKLNYNIFLLTILSRFFVENISCSEFISLYLHVTQF